MGKSTFTKKARLDWAKGVFTTFSVILLVSLKLVNPGDVVENIIIQQTPVLEDRIGTRLKHVLEKFGSDILIILDGLDKIDLEKNEDILKVIRGQKFVYCSLFVTSRPHGCTDVEQHFDTVLQIQGFSKSQSNVYISKILKNPDLSKEVISFYTVNFTSIESWSACPILLLFISILVNHDEIDVKRERVTLGEIYSF